MPQTDWNNRAKSGDARRRATTPKVGSFDDLMKLTRDKLELLAQATGIENAGSMSNKREIATVIHARTTRVDPAPTPEPEPVAPKVNPNRWDYLTQTPADATETASGDNA